MKIIYMEEVKFPCGCIAWQTRCDQCDGDNATQLQLLAEDLIMVYAFTVLVNGNLYVIGQGILTLLE